MRRPIGLICVILCVLGLTTATAQAAPKHAPGPVRHLRGSSRSSTSVSLAWTLPAKKFHATVVRMATGTHAPKTVHSGRSVARFGNKRHSLTVGRLRSGSSYAFSVFTLNTARHAGRRVSTVVAVAPAPMTDLRSFALPAATQLSWTNPRTRSFARVVVRVAKGAAAPVTPSRGRAVRVGHGRVRSASIPGLARNTTYAVSVWALDRKGGYSTPGVVRFTTSAGADPNGTVSGIVTDSAGTGLSGVEIDAVGDLGVGEPTAVTGPHGRFTLSAPADTYTLFVGDGDITGGNSDATGYVSTVGEATVRSGRTTSLAAIALQPGAALNGTLVDARGKPVAGGYPYAVAVDRFISPDDDDFGFYTSGGSLGSRPSAADGSFTLLGVPTDGAVRICAEPSDDTHSAACSEHTLVAGAGSSAAVGSLVLPALEGGTVAGTVRDSRGAAVGDAWVYLEGTGDQSDLFLSAPTDAFGHYTVDAVPPGVYQACAQTAAVSAAHPTGLADNCSGNVVVTAGVRSTANIRLPIGAALTGTVTGPTGHPVAQAQVQVQGRRSGGYTITNSHGQYTVTGLAADSVSVCLETDTATGAGIPTGVQPGCWHRGAKVVVTAGRVRSGVDVRLARGGAVSGTILAADGTPAAYVSVDAESNDDDDDDFDEGSSGQTDARGRYTLRGLPAGSYDVCFDAFTAGGTDVQGCSPSTPTVRVGRTVTKVDGRLPVVSAISVSVHDTAGLPVAGVDAVALSSCPNDCDAQPLFNAHKGVSIDASQATDDTGSALLDGISGGTYAVCLYAFNGTTSAGGSATGYADGCSGSTLTVTVDPGRTTTLALTLQPGGAVSGTITDAAGAPVAGARALVSQSAGTDYVDEDDDDFGDDGDDDLSSPQGYEYSAADGTFTAIGVQPGQRTICIDASLATGSSPAGYADQCLGATSGSSTNGTTLTVTAGATTPAGAVALVAAAGVSGVATQAKRGVVGAQVIVFNNRNVHDFAGSALTGAGGSYTVGRLAPGPVTVCFLARGLHSQCWKNVAWSPGSNPPLDGATLVTVRAGALTGGVNANLR